jgi:predicted ester cyclase
VIQEEQNKDIVRRYWALANQYASGEDISGEVLRWFAPDFRAHWPGVAAPLDARGFLKIVDHLVGGFPNHRYVVEELVAEGDTVASRISFRGKHQGAYMGLPPTNIDVTGSNITIQRVVDGKIAELWVEFDTMGVFRELGALPDMSQLRAA